MTKYLLVDTGVLKTLSMAGELDLLLASGRKIVVTNVVNNEFSQADFDRPAFNAWVGQNRSSIVFENALLRNDTSNVGEKSIIDTVKKYA